MSKKINNKLERPPQIYEGARFSNTIHNNSIHLIGFEFDGTACYRKGAKYGPNDIRKQSPGIETFSPYLFKDTEEISSFLDIGNLPVGKSKNVEKNWQQATDYFFSITKNLNFKEDNIKFLTIGGEHSISYAPITRYIEQYPDLVIIHLDAHADLRDGYENYHYSHASIIRRVLDNMKKHQELIQYGIRSGTKEEFQWMIKNKTLLDNENKFLDKIKSINNSRPIYLTFDLDYFDPSFLPGTGTPEAGGKDFVSFLKLNKILSIKNFVGADVVELSPKIDPTGISSILATTVIRELLLSLNA